MIDIHCHLLPQIDDGPSSIGDALKLAWIATQNGITHSILTPHIQPGLYDNDATSIFLHFIDFKEALLTNGIELEIGMAAEVRACPEIIDMVEQNKIPFLGKYDGYNVILLEFPHNIIPVGSDNLVKALIARGVLPMIAHPERNKDVMQSLNKLQPFIDLGCLLQVTASSVSGYFGPKAKECATQILKNNWCSAIASDAHNEIHRPPDLNPGHFAASQIIGESRAWDLVYTTPFGIVENQFKPASTSIS